MVVQAGRMEIECSHPKRHYYKGGPGAAGAWLRDRIETPVFNVRRWIRLVWFLRTNARLLSSTAKENGMLWGKLATAHDELKFTKRELSEVINSTKMDPVSLAEHYKVIAEKAADTGTAPYNVRDELVLIELVRMSQYVKLNLLWTDESADAIARNMAEETGAQWVEEIYPKTATALGVPKRKQNPKCLDHNHNRAVMDQKDTMLYGGRCR